MFSIIFSDKVDCLTAYPLHPANDINPQAKHLHDDSWKTHENDINISVARSSQKRWGAAFQPEAKYLIKILFYTGLVVLKKVRNATTWSSSCKVRFLSW